MSSPGCSNRRLFAARLDDALTGKRRDDREAIGLLFCDLDGFEEINDQHGHADGRRPSPSGGGHG